MAKVSIEFILPEEEYDFLCYLNSKEAISAILNIKSHIRSRIKHADLSEDVLRELREVQEILADETRGMRDVE